MAGRDAAAGDDVAACWRRDGRAFTGGRRRRRAGDGREQGYQTSRVEDAGAGSRARGAGDPCGRRRAAAVETVAVKVAPPHVRELWLLPHSHVDIGYTHRQDEVVGIQVGNLEKAMALARASAAQRAGPAVQVEPRGGLDARPFPAARDPGAARRVRGRRAVPARWAWTRSSPTCSPACAAPRNCCRPWHRRRASAALTDVPVLSASTCDVPGWTWGIVPMLAQAGVKYFAIGPNYGDRVGTIHQWDDKPFYWKSAGGGERILCWVVDNYHHHGSLEPEVLGQLERLRSSGYAYDTSFMFWVGRVAERRRRQRAARRRTGSEGGGVECQVRGAAGGDRAGGRVLPGVRGEARRVAPRSAAAT